MPETENSLAVFVDFENLALGFEGRRGSRFEIHKVLERLVEKGKIIVKRAYADWGRFREYRTALHEAAIELIEIPKRSMTGKNSADIRLVVDAMDLSYSKEHVQTFVIISGDSDFSPLVSKLKENGKHVIGLGMRNSTSDLLMENCDEFIFYEDLDRPASSLPAFDLAGVPAEKKKLFTLVMDAFVALRRENKEVIWSSMVKDTIKRKKPQFNESYYGYRSFSNVLEDGEKMGLLSLTTDSRSGTYVISEPGTRPRVPTSTNGGERRDERREERYARRRRGGRGRWEERGQRGSGRANAGSSDSRSAAPDSVNDDAVESAASDESLETSPATVETPVASNVSADSAAENRDDRDDYGFPSAPAPASTDDSGDQPSHDGDDRTAEEREMDRRAAAMAQSRETTESPSQSARTTRRATGTGRKKATTKKTPRRAAATRKTTKARTTKATKATKAAKTTKARRTTRTTTRRKTT